jgi:hypothetical protein
VAQSFVGDRRIVALVWADLGAHMSATIFLSGFAMATFWASGVFFLKFWKASHDKFFIYFATTCWLLATERLVSLFVHGAFEDISQVEMDNSSWVYCIRLLAFIMILIAIFEKNRAAKK